MMNFFATVHALPGDVMPEAPLELAGRTVRTLRVDPQALATTAFDCSFETARQRLSQLERMFCEADGSFVWVSSQAGPRWQIDGNLYDHNDRLLFVDLKGNCPSDQFDRLLAAVGWPQTKVMFQLTREAVFLDETEFRRWAGAAEG